MTTLRDAYLAYQAEIGTEEVILERPWVRKMAVAESKSPEPVVSSSHFSIAEGPDFFQALSESLKPQALKPAAVVSSPKEREAPQQPVLQPVSIPDFKNLDAYWEYLQVEYPHWFSSASPLARAEGMPNPVLALVELAPSVSAVPKIFDGEAGLFLDKMMKAINLDRSQMYLTSVMKTPPPGKTWPRKDIARMLPYFFRELQLAACPVILLLGETCAQTILRTGKNLASLSQQIFDVEGLVFAASQHPADVEKNQELRRPAWEDLKWLRPRLGNMSGSIQ